MTNDLAIIEVDTPQIKTRIEAALWAVVCRVSIRWFRLDRVVTVLDRLPQFDSAGPAVYVPTERYFGRAGACLARSLARSQFLRTRGVGTTIVIGAKGSVAAFDAHAWLEPLDAGDRPALHRIHR